MDQISVGKLLKRTVADPSISHLPDQMDGQIQLREDGHGNTQALNTQGFNGDIT